MKGYVKPHYGRFQTNQRCVMVTDGSVEHITSLADFVCV